MPQTPLYPSAKPLPPQKGPILRERKIPGMLTAEDYNRKAFAADWKREKKG